MEQKKYTHIQALEEEILKMRQGGATRQEIADRFGLSKSQEGSESKGKVCSNLPSPEKYPVLVMCRFFAASRSGNDFAVGSPGTDL